MIDFGLCLLDVVTIATAELKYGTSVQFPDFADFKLLVRSANPETSIEREAGFIEDASFTR